MLKCQIRKLFHTTRHADQCWSCLEDTKQASLAERLLAERAHKLNQQNYTPSPFFMAKLAARLRAEAEPYVNSWEHAIPALRGWMFTFSAATLLLIAVAITVNWNTTQPEENIFTANTSDSSQSDAFWMGD